MAIDYANEKGVLVVVAAGNEGVNTDEFGPAGANNVLTVAATGPSDQRANFSNWGKAVKIAAPGVDILSLRARRTDMLLGIPGVEYERERVVCRGRSPILSCGWDVFCGAFRDSGGFFVAFQESEAGCGTGRADDFALGR